MGITTHAPILRIVTTSTRPGAISQKGRVVRHLRRRLSKSILRKHDAAAFPSVPQLRLKNIKALVGNVVFNGIKTGGLSAELIKPLSINK